MMKISDVLEAMESQFDDMQAFYNKNNHDIVYIDLSYVRKYENDALDNVQFYCQEWEKQVIDDAIYFSEHGDEFISLPSSYEINEHQMMVEFAETFPNSKISALLLDILFRKKAFRNFKDMIAYYDVEEQWYSYRDKRFEELAKAWCTKNNLAYEEEML